MLPTGAAGGGSGMMAGGGMMLVGAGIQSYFGNKAASKGRKAMNAAIEEMRRSKAAALGYQQPYYQSGTGGLNALSGLLTGSQYDAQGNKTTLSDQARSDLFQKSPGYQFRLQQGQDALQATQAARGGLLSGGAMKEMNQYSQGIASDEYGNYINQLQTLAGMGQQSANNMSNIEMGMGTQIADYTGQHGMFAAQNAMNQGNIWGGTFNRIGGMMAGGGGAPSAPTPPTGGGF